MICSSKVIKRINEMRVKYIAAFNLTPTKVTVGIDTLEHLKAIVSQFLTEENPSMDGEQICGMDLYLDTSFENGRIELSNY